MIGMLGFRFQKIFLCRRQVAAVITGNAPVPVNGCGYGQSILKNGSSVFNIRVMRGQFLCISHPGRRTSSLHPEDVAIRYKKANATVTNVKIRKVPDTGFSRHRSCVLSERENSTAIENKRKSRSHYFKHGYPNRESTRKSRLP
jgi:hypothetical protein